MSFKSEASKVKANIAAGNYKEKTDVFAGFFDELTYGLKKQDEAKRQEELESKREKRANDREILKRQKEQDRLEQSQNRLANLYFTTTGQDKTTQNKSSVLSIIKDGGINNYSDLVKVMGDTSSYTEGRTQQDIDTQMSELQTNLSEDGALFNAAKNEVDQTTREGSIKFGRQDKKVLSMALDEVLFELSSENLSEDRKQELERRRKSLQPEKDYVDTKLYKDDGSEVTARSETEEMLYKAQGFVTIKTVKEDFPERFVYKEGARIEVFTQEKLDELENDGWSTIEPAKAVTFVPRFVYKEGARREVTNQVDLDQAIKDGFGPTQFDKAEPVNEILYKEGASVPVSTAEEYKMYADAGWVKIKPKVKEQFKERTLYNDNGDTRVVINQKEFDEGLADGFSITNKATKNFENRELFHPDGRKVKITNEVDLAAAAALGFTIYEPAKVTDFKDIPLYLDGNKVVVRSLDNYNKYKKLGYDEVQLGPISQIVKDLDVDRAKASEIKNGTLKVGTNVRGETTLTNTATGEVEVLGAAQTTNVTPENLTLDQAIEDGASINPDSNVNWKSTTTTFQVSETIVDGKVVPAQTIQVTPRMIQEAKSDGIDFDNIGDIKSAFGLKGAIAKGLGQLGGLIGQDWLPETNDAIVFLENLRLNSLITLAGTAANGLRDSVWNKQQILTTLAEPGRVWKGAAFQHRKLKSTAKEINRGIQVSIDQINSPTSNEERQAKAKVTLAALQALKTKYDKVLSVFDKDVTGAKIKQRSYISEVK